MKRVDVISAIGLGVETGVREWVRRRLGSVEHEMRVARVAKKMFELTQRWHGLGGADCRLLMLGAMVHDVGRAMGEKGHAKRGAEMVLAGRGLELGERERRRLAYLTRHHKGDVPAAGEDGILDGHEDDTEKLRLLLGMLRAADGLDSRRLGGPTRLVMAVKGKGVGRVLMIYGYVAGNASAAEALYGRGKKFRLMEEMLGCEVRREWVGMEEMGMVG